MRIGSCTRFSIRFETKCEVSILPDTSLLLKPTPAHPLHAATAFQHTHSYGDQHPADRHVKEAHRQIAGSARGILSRSPRRSGLCGLGRGVGRIRASSACLRSRGIQIRDDLLVQTVSDGDSRCAQLTQDGHAGGRQWQAGEKVATRAACIIAAVVIPATRATSVAVLRGCRALIRCGRASIIKRLIHIHIPPECSCSETPGVVCTAGRSAIPTAPRQYLFICEISCRHRRASRSQRRSPLPSSGCPRPSRSGTSRR